MASQELPRPGGFPAIRYQRNLPKRGPSGLVLMAGLTTVCGLGMYRAIDGVKERKEIEREKTWARIHLVPLLQAETDRDHYRREQAMQAEEEAIMRNVPDWEVNAKGGASAVYHTDRYIPRTIIPAVEVSSK
ncbi:GRIM-19 [Syncephalis pseudoplumigaleata]|uniref:NADH dehydrogenase [ubiquinone] 1 alpha subcomplex subunit 13 n=1 Tax=Syncephalis pseudoplumigaleata TaxID=1712513 RepID=A0A4P9YTP6_9FUNG|nr:GRIM-19 [Syncephalis pseudoplumigaleata]RKP22869.1 GRIM-19 [Syncephalis pseudoplumigaleata]|eukprot:RKP22742.1 GRIM-19 [Syncephalis pseudoplumigaleata]